MSDPVLPMPSEADPPPGEGGTPEPASVEAEQPPRLGCGGLIRRFPVTFALTVVTGLFFLLEGLLGGTSDMQAQFRLGALRGDLVWERHEFYRLVGAVFLHHGWFHFLVNWFAFLQLGSLIEYVYGSRRMLVFYLLAGFVGSLASASFMDAVGGSRGSSGAIFGLAGVTLHLLWRHPEALRETVIDTERTRKRLGQCVGFMFVLGIGLAAIGVGVIDNYGHGGGFVTGVVCARLVGDPHSAPGTLMTYAAAWLVALALAGFLAIAVHGGQSYDAIHELVVIHNGSDRVEAYRASSEPEAGRAAFAKDVAAVSSVAILETLQSQLYLQRFDREAAIVVDRWLQVAPDDPSALNARAWLHVTSLDDRHRPALALPLVEKALEVAKRTGGPLGKSMRAGFLDTRAEALFQLGRHAEALVDQREAVALMEELTKPPAGWSFARLLNAVLGPPLQALMRWNYGERAEGNPLPDMRRRLAKIERAARAAGVAPVDSR